MKVIIKIPYVPKKTTDVIQGMLKKEEEFPKVDFEVHMEYEGNLNCDLHNNGCPFNIV